MTKHVLYGECVELFNKKPIKGAKKMFEEGKRARKDWGGNERNQREIV